jgi:hypothetical protein
VLCWRGVHEDRIRVVRSPRKRQWLLVDRPAAHAAVAQGKAMDYPVVPAIAKAAAEHAARAAAAPAAAPVTAAVSTAAIDLLQTA